MRNAEVAQKWAKNNGDSATGSNFYYTHRTIYSYGPHFPIARFVQSPKGVWFVVFTTRAYGIATGVHKNRALVAIPSNIQLVFVDDVTSHPKQWVADVLSGLKELCERLTTRHKLKDRYKEEALKRIHEIKFLDEQYGMKTDLPVSKELSLAVLDSVVA